MENIRYNISPCSTDETTAFVEKIDTATFVPNGMVSATEKSHYDRYSYLCEECRVAIVYDRSANILSITGRSDHASKLLDVFGANDKSVKRSTVPSQGTVPVAKSEQRASADRSKSINRTKLEIKSVQISNDNGTRAKLFVSPDSLRRRAEHVPVPTMVATSRGAVMDTDEIFPPQISYRNSNGSPDEYSGFFPPDVSSEHTPSAIKKRPLPSYGETAAVGNVKPKVHEPPAIVNSESAVASQQNAQPTGVKFGQEQGARLERAQAEYGRESGRPAGIAISVSGRASGAPRRIGISFGSEDDDKKSSGELRINTRAQASMPQSTDEVKRRRGRPPKAKPAQPPAIESQQTEKRRRGRPPKMQKAQNDVVGALEPQPYEYKNGYSVKNFPAESLDQLFELLKESGKSVVTGEVEFGGTLHEVKNYHVEDDGQRVILRYATKRMTLQLQGKRSNLFGEVMSIVGNFSDYSSALENYVEETDGGKKVSELQDKLKRRLPTAFGFLSEQSRIDFSYGIHDFSQNDLRLSDYSVLLVPAFRGLERFVFDLQNAEGIKVKMIGQAFDKDDNGNYILKSGYTQRIGSVIYAEVLVSLYTEYFAQRNYFAHSDNTDSNVSRSISERSKAQRIFDGILDIVEYNSKKLKEIGFGTRAKV